MRIKSTLMFLSLCLCSIAAYADLDPWKDYEPSEFVWSVTTIKVDANMGDAYLEGLKHTWVETSEIAKKLGQIEDYRIYRSDLPMSGGFNLMLFVKFKDTNALAPNRKNYEDFIKAVGKANVDETTEYAQKNYPAMREITGQYLMREITVK